MYIEQGLQYSQKYSPYPAAAACNVATVDAIIVVMREEVLTMAKTILTHRISLGYPFGFR